MPIDAGALDREIVIKTATTTQNATGQEIKDWDLQDETVWAQWLPGGTREAFQAQQRLNSYIDGVYKIYDRDEPLANQTRILGHDGRTYETKPAIEIGRHEGWLIPVVALG